MNLDELKALRDKIGEDASTVTDEQLDQAVTAIREQVATAKTADKTPELIETLEAIKTVREAVTGEQGNRTAAIAAQTADAERLLGELDTPDEDPKDDQPAEPAPAAAENAENADDQPVDEAPKNEDAVTEPELEPALAASGTHLADAIVKGVKAAFAAEKAAAKTEVVGRKADRITPAGTTPTVTAGDNTVHGKVFAGKDGTGRALATTMDVANAFVEVFRGDYQNPSNARFPIVHVDAQYPDGRRLGSNYAENFVKMAAAEEPKAIVAAGGLCAPLENLYDVEVLGSADRPIMNALNRFQVERGGVQFRPNTSAASAVYGAGVWTLADDVAGTGTKACYQVDCAGLQQEVIEAIYLCLEFSNITSMYDPETTAANVAQGTIAHARLAENRLLAKMNAQSKILTGAQTVGAARDILVNLDKITAYYRNRHRLPGALPLTWIAPMWVQSLIRTDLARQMAAGDWTEALAPADSLINSWFSARGVSPVWHMDGFAGADEVQTVTVTGAPTGGNFTLTFGGQTTANIAYNASASAVESALAALNNVRDEDITVTGAAGGPYTITFDGGYGGAYDGANVAQMTSANTFTGGTSPTVTVATTIGGGGTQTVSGVNVVAQTYADAAAGSAIPNFPTQIDSLLFAPGSWMFLDGGELNLGLVRDSQLNSRNKYRQFQETFEGAAFRGIESLRPIMSVVPNGSTVGTIAPSAVTS